MNATTSTFRLVPGADLRGGIEAACRRRRLRAAAIVTAVGSLRHARLRFADAMRITDLAGPFEIVSLVGTVAIDGAHLHVALAGAEGRLVGGHLAPGSIVHTTAEVVVLEDARTAYHRRLDPHTGYRELVPARRRTP